MIAVIDYGAGNLFSVVNALNYIGLDNITTRDKAEIQRADAMILPGVGAFPKAMEMLWRAGLIECIKQEALKKPLLGICLGMQMLFDYSEEFGFTEGLGLIGGNVRRIECGMLKIPHIGWNELIVTQDDPLLKGVDKGSSVYFVHSFMAYADKANTLAVTDYGGPVTALVKSGFTYGAQFHPEKSGEVGLQILRNFGGLV